MNLVNKYVQFNSNRKMSGLIGNTNEMKFITTFQGKFEIRVAEGSEGAINRTTKTGKSISVLQFNKLSGRLVDIKSKDSEYGKRFMFHFINDGEKAALEAPISSAVTTTIVNRLENLDLSQDFEIVIKYNPSKERAMFFINQNGEGVEDKYQRWDKEANKFVNMHDYPNWEKKTLNGEEVWDKSSQIKFHINVISKVLPSIQGNSAGVSKTETPAAPESTEEPSEEILF